MRLLELLDLVNVGVPENRREAAVYLAGLGLLVSVIFGAAMLSEMSSGSSLIPSYAVLPRWLEIAGPLGIAALVLGILVYVVDSEQERHLRNRVGKRPRIE